MEKSSIKNLGYPLGYFFSFYSCCVLLSIPFFVWIYGFTGLLISNVLRWSIFITDYYTSNATEYNLSIIEKNGYDSKKIFQHSILRLFIGPFFVGSLYVYIFDGAKAHYDLCLLRNVIIAIILVEIYFTIAHKALHRYFPDLHRMHHCCLRPSITSNLFLERVDTLLEFHLPLFLLYIINVAILQDYFSFIVCIAIVVTWYLMDHDEYIKLPHWYHHHYINSNYGAYLKNGSFDSMDKIKRMVLR